MEEMDARFSDKLPIRMPKKSELTVQSIINREQYPIGQSAQLEI
jgi:hypothetical protein